MLVPERHLEELSQQGFTLIPRFLSEDQLAEAQEALWGIYPRPEAFFANPAAYPDLLDNPFNGVRNLPFSELALNRLALNEQVADLARAVLEADDIRLYKGELWAKYAGAAPYEQTLHRDYGNHMLVVPRADGYGRQLNTYLYLGDVTEANGATAFVPVEHTRHIRLGVRRLAPGVLAHREQRLSGPAGSLVLYSGDVFHRATELTGEWATRFLLLCDFRRADTSWVSKHAFGHHGNRQEMEELMIHCTPAQRALIDVPPPGHEYWNEQTLDDMEIRYPGIDTGPYRRLLSSGPVRRS